MKLSGSRTVPLCCHVTFSGVGFPSKVQLIVTIFPTGNTELAGVIDVMAAISKIKE